MRPNGKSRETCSFFMSGIWNWKRLILEKRTNVRYNEKEVCVKGGIGMKIVAKPIDAIVVFQQGSHPVPHKFKYMCPDGSMKYVQVERIFASEIRKAGNSEVILYQCQSRIEGEAKRYELKFFLKEARWELYKI